MDIGRNVVADLWAHSVNTGGHRHGLADHLRGTAALARGFGEVFDVRELCGYVGLVHDVGKGACAWQSGLMRAEAAGGRVADEGGRSIDHKMAGTWLIAKRARLGLFAMPVLGHHGGLCDRQKLKKVLAAAEGTAREQVQEAIEGVAPLVPEVLAGERPVLPSWVKDELATDLLLRMVFSTLVDADFLDTDMHFSGEKRTEPIRLSEMAADFERERARYLASPRRPSPVDVIRGEVYAQAVAAASQPVGIFPFPAPTGAGKTISAGGFAVHHAARHGLRRVIVAVPYMSITEQNAKVYRRLFGETNVLEHHSGVDLHDLPVNQRWQRLAAENWDAPVVVTTTVRLFESLFSNKPSAMRKLHRLAGSVIVLDEVQSLPDQLLLPILSVLRHLTEYFGTSVVLASATQPDFFSLDVFQKLVPREVIAKPQPLYERLRRVTYDWWYDPGPTFAEVAAEAAEQPQVLLIVNTTGDAAKLHRHLADIWDHDGPVLHLSTRMASEHRRKILDQVRRWLRDGSPIALVSTQLVEAGVDLDFPTVFRALAPAEALQQAAGRANRNGLLEKGRVVVFDPVDGSVKGTRLVYGAALDISRSFFGKKEEGLAQPDDLEALREYYRTRYKIKNVEGAGLGRKIEDWRCDFDFPQVARHFKMIDEQSVAVLVPYGDEKELDRLRQLLTQPGRVEQWVYRRLQPHVAALPKRLAELALTEGLATLLVGDLYEWHGGYHEQRGIEFTYPNPEDYVW